MTFNCTKTESELNRLLCEKFTSEFRTGYIEIGGICLPEYFQHFADRIENFEVRHDDIWVCSFPKTGEFDSFKKRMRINFIFSSKKII